MTSGAGFLATIAALGLPNVITRHVANAENSRELVVAAIASIATVGTGLCLITVLVLGPHLPPALDLEQPGRMVLLVTVLVVFTAVSALLNAGLVATRSSHAVFIKNVAASIVKVVALLLLVSFPSSGLLMAYGLGLLVATVLGSISLGRQVGGRPVGSGSVRILRRYLSVTSANYIASILGSVPVSIVPIEVLVIRGAAEAGRFAVAFLIAGFLNFIPSTVAQVLFAEASRRGVPLGVQLRKAIRGIYGLLLPALVIVVAAAPLLLRIFGVAYAAAATGCLRVLALSTVLMGGTYLVDSLLIARDRIAAYVFMNCVNGALVLGLVGIMLPRGLTAAAGGWALAQGLSLLLGVLVLATARSGRHRLEHRSSSRQAASALTTAVRRVGDWRLGNVPGVQLGFARLEGRAELADRLVNGDCEDRHCPAPERRVRHDVPVDFEPYRGELVAYCYRMLGSFHDAENLAQETILRAWKARGRYDRTRASVRTWLYWIAANACLSALQGRARRPLPSGLGAPSRDPRAPLTPLFGVPWLQPFPDARFDPGGMRVGMRLAQVAAMQLLPPRQRAVLVLREVLEFSASEVAAQLGTTVPAVNSALERARAVLAGAGDVGEVTEPDDPGVRAVIKRYVQAFEAADIPALVRLLADEAVLELPPVPLWYRGSRDYGLFMRRLFEMRGPGWAMTQLTANGQPALAAYAPEPGGGHRLHTLQVFTVTGGQVARNVVFADSRVFEAFDLPGRIACGEVRRPR